MTEKVSGIEYLDGVPYVEMPPSYIPEHRGYQIWTGEKWAEVLTWSAVGSEFRFYLKGGEFLDLNTEDEPKVKVRLVGLEKA